MRCPDVRPDTFPVKAPYSLFVVVKTESRATWIKSIYASSKKQLYTELVTDSFTAINLIQTVGNNM